MFSHRSAIAICHCQCSGGDRGWVWVCGANADLYVERTRPNKSGIACFWRAKWETTIKTETRQRHRGRRHPFERWNANVEVVKMPLYLWPMMAV